MVGHSLNHYRVLDRVGAGGMGVVYRARDERLGRDVALKILPPETASDPVARTRLLAEARVASSLNHPNICTIYEVGEAEGQAFIAMEFVEGETLAARIPAGGLPTETLLDYGAQIAAGLEHAHGHGVIHRDLKSSNVRVTAEGRCKILDFGLAVHLKQPEAASETQSQAAPSDGPGVAGTLAFMAPETLKGEAPDARSDLWALGVVLHEMVTGSLPFRGTTGFAVSTAILRDPPAALPDHVPQGLRDAIHHCLTKEPAGRYQTAGELRVVLETLIADRPAREGSLGVPRHRALVAAAGLLGALLLVSFAVPAVRGRIQRWFRTSQLPAAQTMQLAVLPPRVVDTDPETSAFGNGLTETLTRRLTQLSGRHPLEVVPAGQVRQRKVETIQQAREEFGVGLGLEISLHRVGDRIRVNYSLVDSATLRQVAADTITAPASDPFAVEDRVAESVLRALEIRLNPAERRAQADYGTSEPAAYDYYLQGRGYLQQPEKPENLANAIAVFRHALERDPNYALAYAGLGEAYWRTYEQTRNASWVEESRGACQRAAALAPERAQPRICLGTVYNGTGAYEQAVGEFRKAVVDEPTSDAAVGGLANAYDRLGKPEEAEQSYRQAIALRPNYWATYNSLGAFYVRHGKYREATEMFRQVVKLVPDSFLGYGNVGGSLVLAGDYEGAIPQLERSIAIRPTALATANLGTAYFQLKRYAEAARTYEKAVKLDENSYEVWGNLGDAYYWAPGRRGDAPAAYRRAIELARQKLQVNSRDANLRGYVAAYYAMLGDRPTALAEIEAALHLTPRAPDLLFNAALVHNQLGDEEKAIEFLQRAVAAGFSKSTLRDSPNFDNLRGNPRFQRLLAD